MDFSTLLSSCIPSWSTVGRNETVNNRLLLSNYWFWAA